MQKQVIVLLVCVVAMVSADCAWFLKATDGRVDIYRRGCKRGGENFSETFFQLANGYRITDPLRWYAVVEDYYTSNGIEREYALSNNLGGDWVNEWHSWILRADELYAMRADKAYESPDLRKRIVCTDSFMIEKRMSRKQCEFEYAPSLSKEELRDHHRQYVIDQLGMDE